MWSWTRWICRAAARATSSEPNTRRSAASAVTQARVRGRAWKLLWCTTPAATSGWATSITSARCTSSAVTGSATMARTMLSRPKGAGVAGSKAARAGAGPGTARC